MKKYMPLEGLRWSRDSGSALCDTSQNSRSRTGWGAHLPYLFLNVEPLKKERKKENEKGSLENYLAGNYRCTYCRRHHARCYQLHVN